MSRDRGSAPPIRPPRDAGILRTLLLASLLPPLLGIHALALRRPAYWPHADLLLLYALGAWAAFEAARRARLPLAPFLALATLHLVVLAPEVLLRLAGFRYQSGIQFGYPRPDSFRSLVRHEAFFWTLPPGAAGASSLGFATIEPAPKERGLQRLLVLGDSVASQGFPETAAVLLGARRGGRRYQVVNLSLPGYSSYQGRALVERYAATVEADLALVDYGWNDHWLAWGETDAEKVVSVSDSLPVRAAHAIAGSSRLVQAFQALLTRQAPLDRLRVPPEDYRRNLLRIGERLDQLGVVPIFATAPSSHEVLGVPDYLVEQGFVRDAASVPELHRRYNGIVRGLASEHGWPLLDLDAELSHAPSLPAIFVADGIHLTPGGVALFAERLAAGIERLARSPRRTPIPP